MHFQIVSKVLCFWGDQAISLYNLVVYALSGQKRFVWGHKNTGVHHAYNGRGGGGSGNAWGESIASYR